MIKLFLIQRTNNMSKYLITFLLLFTSSLTTAYSEDATVVDSKSGFDRLKKLVEEQQRRSEEADKLSEEREKIIQELIQVAEDEDDKSIKKYYAIELLGKYRAEKAVEVISDYMLVDSPLPYVGDYAIRLLTDHVALKALIKIGMPAIPQMINNILYSDDHEVKKRELSALVIIEILGNSLGDFKGYNEKTFYGCEASRMLFEIHMKAAKDERSKQRLSDALNYCDRYHKVIDRAINNLYK
jgi:HEAT repeat protein